MSEPVTIETVDGRAVTTVDAVGEHVVLALTFFAATTARYCVPATTVVAIDQPPPDPVVLVPTLEKDACPGVFLFNTIDRVPTQATLAEVTFPVKLAPEAAIAIEVLAPKDAATATPVRKVPAVSREIKSTTKRLAMTNSTTP
jgi:hypothetical protein